MLNSISHRLNTFLLVLLVLMVASIIAIMANRAGAGPLDPPAPVASTQQNLIFEPTNGCPGFPITIGASGSYKLAQNIVLPGCPTDGIDVNVSNVTIDLAGFSLIGSGGIGSGIYIPASSNNVTIRNGTVRDWAGGYGIRSASSQDQLDGVHVINNYVGIVVGSGTSLSNCLSEANGAHGIDLSGTNSVVTKCDIVGNGGLGMYVAGSQNVIEDNAWSGNDTCGCVIRSLLVDVGANQNRIDGNFIDANGVAHAIEVGGASNIITRNTGGTQSQPCSIFQARATRSVRSRCKRRPSIIPGLTSRTRQTPNNS